MAYRNVKKGRLGRVLEEDVRIELEKMKTLVEGEEPFLSKLGVSSAHGMQ